MNSNLIGLFAFGLFAIGTVTVVCAEDPIHGSQNLDVGKYEYESHCSICHGANGAGPGRYPSWSYLSVDIPNIAALADRNGGSFPFKRVYDFIDGRDEAKVHGRHDMPIWGEAYKQLSARLNADYDHEAFGRAKILALTEYIYHLQQHDAVLQKVELRDVDFDIVVAKAKPADAVTSSRAGTDSLTVYPAGSELAFAVDDDVEKMFKDVGSLQYPIAAFHIEPKAGDPSNAAIIYIAPKAQAALQR